MKLRNTRLVFVVVSLNAVVECQNTSILSVDPRTEGVQRVNKYRVYDMLLIKYENFPINFIL